MKLRSLRFRLIAWYAGLLLALAIAFGIYTCGMLAHYLSASLTRTLQRRANQIASRLIANIEATGEENFREQLKSLYAPEVNDRFIRVTRTDGRVIYVSGAPNDKTFDPSTVLPAPVNAGKPAIYEHQGAGEEKLLIASVPGVSGKQRYIVEVGASEESRNRVLEHYILTLVFGLAVVVAIAISGGYILIGRSLSPVARITAAAREITLQRLKKRLPVAATGDEIEDLSRAINEMIVRIGESFQATVRFTSDASHELRTPLTILRGELEALLLDAELKSSVRAMLESLLEEAERLGKIVEGLLALSRLDAGAGQTERVRFDLAALVATTSEQMCLLAEEKSINVTLIAERPVFIQGDPARIKQVIVNLLDNAIKYTPNGGRIEATVSEQGARALFSIVDTGPGIGMEALPYVFERFYRAQEVRAKEIEGAGLGLSIVKAICTAHGGSIQATNLSEGGTRFTIDLPLAKTIADLT